MNKAQMALIKWLYYDLGNRPSTTLAFQSLLHDEADRTPHYPQDWHEFNLCLQLINMVPGAGESIPDLAARSPHWRAFQIHWDALTAMLIDETNGRMVYPWPHRTDHAVQHIVHQVDAGIPPVDTSLPDDTS